MGTRKMLKYFAKEHTMYGLMIQIGVGAFAYGIGLVTGLLPTASLLMVGAWLGMSAVSGFFISREYSQREGRLGITGHAKPLEGFMGWDGKSVGDALSPIVVCTALALIVTYV